MSSIRKTHDLEEVRSAWDRIFRTNDPFEWPFRTGFQAGRVFYPTDGYHLSESQYQALCASIAQSGEREFCISITESEGPDLLGRTWGHWLWEMPSYGEYAGLSLTLENALFSRAGRWGVLISHEQHALVTGCPQFLTALSAHDPSGPSDLLRLREAWSDYPRAGWLGKVLSHVRDES
ncbi:MAG: hypothetical protein RL885_24835 [Planctomycetota bacterium]